MSKNLMYKLDKDLFVVGLVKNYYNDEFTEALEDNKSYLTFSTDDELKVEDYVLYPRHGGGSHQIFVIKEVSDESDGFYDVECEVAATGELVNDYVHPKIKQSYNITKALEYILERVDWTPGFSEIDRFEELEWSDWTTVKESLNELSDVFGVELAFRVEFDGTQITGKYIDAFTKRGDQNANHFLEVGWNSENIKKTVNSDNVISAVYIEGNNGLNLNGFDTRPLPHAGFINQGTWIENRAAVHEIGHRGYHKFGLLKIDTNSQETLWLDGIKHLKENMEPIVEYDVDGFVFEDAQLGDSVIIKDFTNEDSEPLLLAARIIELTRSHSDEALESMTLGEYRRIPYVKPENLKDIQDKLKDIEEQLNNLPDLEGSTITQANTPPQDPKDGQLWLDTATQPYIIYRYDAANNEWTTLNETPDAIHVSDTEPENPYNNQLWLNTNSTPEELLRWDAATNTWTPTFESTESIIEAVSQSSQIQSLFNQKADKTELDTLATVEEVNDKIGQVQQQVGSVVSSIDNRVQPLEDQVGSIETRLEAMPGELALKFASNSAGINLLKNSIGFAISSYFYHDANGQVQQNKDIDFWTYGINELATQAQYGLVISDPDNEGYGSLWSSAPNPSQSAKAYQAVSNLVVGDKYSISGLFRKDRATDVSLLRVFYRDSSGVMRQIGATIGLTGTSSEWKVATQTFVAPSTQIYVQFEIKSFERGKTAITGLMLNKGDIPYGWTPASDELYATGISFNVNGIKVQTDTNFTQMTAREFAGYAQTETGETERIFSLNGDTTEVANLQAQYEIRMGNIKIRNVNESANKGWSFLGN